MDDKPTPINFLRRLWRLPENAVRVEVPDDFGQVGAEDRWGIKIMRGRAVEETVKHGPNAWHALIAHPDGSYENLGVSHNLVTTAGLNYLRSDYGHATGKGGALTAATATSATPSGGGLTTDAYKGWRVYCPVTALTTAPVYGNIGSNSTTVLTVDGWWVESADTMTGTTPASTNGYVVHASGSPRFMGLTADSGAAAAGDTVLASEQTANGLGRAKATYATGGNGIYTLANTYSVTGSVTVHKGGLFTAANTTAAGIMVFEAVLNSDAVVVNLDSLTVTATVTLS
jgi:hypothetical protein